MNTRTYAAFVVSLLFTTAATSQEVEHRDPSVPLPTPARPVAVERMTNAGLHTNVFLEPTYCSGGTTPKMTAFYKGTLVPASQTNGVYDQGKYASITYCNGKPTVISYYGMTYDDVRNDVANGRIVDQNGVSPDIRLTSIGYRVRLPENSYFDAKAYWAEPAVSAPQRAAGTVSSPAQQSTLESDLANSLAQAFGRAPRIQAGLSMGMAQIVDNEVLVDVKVQTQEYRIDVRPGARCVAAGTRQRCTYSFMITAGGSFAGISVPQQNTGWITRTDLFEKAGRSYRSAATDQLMLQAATPPQGPARRDDGPVKQPPTIGCDAGIIWLCNN